MNKIIIFLLIIVLLVGGLYLLLGKQAVNAPESESVLVTEVQVALLDTEQTSESDIQRGCDLVTFTTREVAPTTAPLAAAMNELFSMEETQVGGYYNFMANTNDTLSFSHAEIDNGTARIYLAGQLTGLAGVCDDPRAQIQIEETALQFPTVSNVEIYLNQELTNLTPSQQ